MHQYDLKVTGSGLPSPAFGTLSHKGRGTLIQDSA